MRSGFERLTSQFADQVVLNTRRERSTTVVIWLDVLNYEGMRPAVPCRYGATPARVLARSTFEKRRRFLRPIVFNIGFFYSKGRPHPL